MEKITARTNEKIKYAVRLGESASFRKQNGEFFLEGARLCFDAAKTGVEIRQAFFTAAALEKYSAYTRSIIATGCICCEISGDVAKKLSDTENPQGVFCICKKKESLSVLNCNGKYLALENLQDPSNLGAVCRTVEALGLDGLIVSGGCDVYNPKAMRAAMGSLLRISLIETDNLIQLLEEAKSNGMNTYASVPRSDAQDIRKADLNGGVIICVGNEGSGLSQAAIDTCETAVTIPMGGRAESFNASAAAAILAWELMR
ncbi:MAG: RNA methyltransferase [Clostridia bacterium]|nr:RNA methyltransferase [Clostridia bacterium]